MVTAPPMPRTVADIKVRWLRVAGGPAGAARSAASDLLLDEALALGVANLGWHGDVVGPRQPLGWQ